MTRDIRIIPARDFLSARADGRVDIEESLRLLREVVDALHPTEAFDVMLDTREALSNLTAAELWYLADAAGRHPRLQSCRLCILSSDQRFDHASFYVDDAEPSL